MRLVIAWIAYQIVMYSPVGMFHRRGVRMRWWARACLPLAGEWEYRHVKGETDEQ